MLNSSQFLGFIGIAVSMLLIFVILDKDNNLYSKILEEIVKKVDKALRNSESKISRYYTRVIRLISGPDSSTKPVKRIAKRWNKIIKGRNSLSLMRINISDSKSKESLSILQQAPLYTALFCLLVTGMEVYYNISGKCTTEVSLAVFYFIFFSSITWLLAWIYRTFIVGFHVAFNKSIMKMPKYREWFSRHTNFSTLLFPIAPFFVIWILAILIMSFFKFDCSHFIILVVIYLLFGIPCYLAKDPTAPVTYVNFYGQILMILGVAIFTQLVSVWFNEPTVPSTLLSVEIQSKFVFHFVFWNGFTLPILMPSFWFSLAPIIGSLLLRLRLRCLGYDFRRHERFIKKRTDSHKPS